MNYPANIKTGHKLRNIVLALLSICAAVSFASAHAGETKCRQTREILTVEESGATPSMQGAINDKPLKIEFDTGSSRTALSEGAATRLELPLSRQFNHLSLGIGGSARNYVATVKKITFGPVTAKNLWPTVIGDEGQPANFDMLLGSDYLMNFDLEIFMKEKKISFFRNTGCDDTYLAGWDDNAFLADLDAWKTDDDRRPFLTVEINGQKIRALIDTGASSSMLNTAAATKAGVSLPPMSEEDKKFYGIGAMHASGRVATLKSFAIGDETIMNPKIFVGDIWAGVQDDMKSQPGDELMKDMPDMLIGMDFIKAHRMLIAPSQKRLYFTYLGGPVFYTAKPPAEAAKETPQ